MTARWSRWGATSGVVLCLLWAPMGLIVPQLPDLGSPAAIEHFHRSHEALLKAVLLLASCGFFFLLCFLGVLVERLRRAEGAGSLTWIALGSALLFMTALNIAIGLAAAAATIRPTALPAHRRMRSETMSLADRPPSWLRGRRPVESRLGPRAP